MVGQLNDDVPRTAEDLLPTEFEASRLLIGATRAQVAQQTNVSEATIKRIEGGEPSRSSSRAELVDFYLMYGIRYSRHPGQVFWLGPNNRLRLAPTYWRVGPLHGERIRLAAYRLALPIEHLAGKAKVPVITLKRMLKQENLQAAPTLPFYAVVGWLEENGYCFKRWSQGGDKAKDPRPRPELKDLSYKRLWGKPSIFTGLGLSTAEITMLEKELEGDPEVWNDIMAAIGAK